jgi:oxalate decarboxylase/phosphoglucose isomerase-like protein (cupin superfamily)
MHVQFQRHAQTRYEYGCDLRRIYPWDGLVDPLWGGAIASVRPGERTTAHAHDEHETFLVLAGRGEITVDDEREEITRGDVVYLPRNSSHSVLNISKTEPFVFLTIFWGSPEANLRTIALADELRGEAG